MEQFMMEHGGIIVSCIVSAVSLIIIFMILIVVGNMEICSMTGIIGE